jgi:hypothetical protein
MKEIVRNMDGVKKLDQLLAELKQKSASTQAADDKKPEVKQDNKENNKDNKKDDKHPADSNGKKPEEGATPPASRHGINEVRQKNKDKDNSRQEDEGNKFELHNPLGIPFQHGASTQDDQGKEPQDKQESDPGTITPRVPLGPSLHFLEATLSLNSKIDKKAARSKKYSKEQVGVAVSTTDSGTKDKNESKDKRSQ